MGFADMAFVRCTLQLPYNRRLKKTLSESEEVVPKSGVKNFDFDKLYIGSDFVHSNTIRTGALKFEMCLRMSVYDPMFFGRHDTEVFAVSPNACRLHYVRKLESWRGWDPLLLSSLPPSEVFAYRFGLICEGISHNGVLVCKLLITKFAVSALDYFLDAAQLGSYQSFCLSNARLKLSFWIHSFVTFRATLHEPRSRTSLHCQRL